MSEVYTSIRISIVDLGRLRARADRNFRSTPKEISFLLDLVETMEKTGVMNVEAILPPVGEKQPAELKPIPLVIKKRR